MKIDWSKWFFTVTGSGYDVEICNPEQGIKIWIGATLHDIRNMDDPSKAIKEAVKDEIRKWYVGKQRQEWEGKQIPVEDNLDYIENEAEKRGLI